MLIGQPFALAAGVAVIWTRLFYAERIARRFKDARAAGVLRVRHRFRDAYEVEIGARCVTGSVRYIIFSVNAHALHASHVHDAQLTHIYGGSGVPERKTLTMSQSWLGWMLLT
jgi:hypothetical protein